MKAFVSRTGHAATSKDAHWWKRDPYHLSEDGKLTLCGRKVEDWSEIDPPRNHGSDCCKGCLRSRRIAYGFGQ